jgi:hypothetical protein
MSPRERAEPSESIGAGTLATRDMARSDSFGHAMHFGQRRGRWQIFSHMEITGRSDA